MLSFVVGVVVDVAYSRSQRVRRGGRNDARRIKKAGRERNAPSARKRSQHKTERTMSAGEEERTTVKKTKNEWAKEKKKGG
jgi:hypothetical protein